MIVERKQHGNMDAVMYPKDPRRKKMTMMRWMMMQNRKELRRRNRNCLRTQN
jgi:hypothetical protein